MFGLWIGDQGAVMGDWAASSQFPVPSPIESRNTFQTATWYQSPLLVKTKFFTLDFKLTRTTMLPLLHFQRYQEFQHALEQMRKIIALTDLEGAALRDSFQTVQQLFQHRIATLCVDELAPEYAPRWQSLQTEIHRTMRLLETDILLLLSARSPATSERRIVGVRDRINTLIQYCEALLQL